jgi:UDP-N-acetylmuramate dehydrogenase
MSWNSELRDSLSALGAGALRFDAPLAERTALGLGGTADALLEASEPKALAGALRWCEERDLPWTRLDSGSFALVRDGGLRGLTIVLVGDFQDTAVLEGPLDGRVLVRAGAGSSLSEAVAWCAQRGYSGLESLAGLPGTLTDALALNLGTRDAAIGQRVRSMRWLQPDGHLRTVAGTSLEWGNRRSSLPARALPVDVVLDLETSDPERVAAASEAQAERRKLPEDERRSPGLFRNPEGADPAGSLLDGLGFRGLRLHGIRVSEHHANRLVNEGEGLARHALALVRLMRERVASECGVKLELQLKILGQDPDKALKKQKKNRSRWR